MMQNLVEIGEILVGISMAVTSRSNVAFAEFFNM